MTTENAKKETFISVDVETTGPTPRSHDLYEFGAVVVGERHETFFREVALTSIAHVPEALAACGRSLAGLVARDADPAIAAMRDFDAWVYEIAAARDARPVFVEFGGGFDWQFMNALFHALRGYNPFGHSALDIKSYYMGLTDCSWDETRMSQLDPRFRPTAPLTHNALEDALAQEEIFSKLLAEQAARKAARTP